MMRCTGAFRVIVLARPPGRIKGAKRTSDGLRFNKKRSIGIVEIRDALAGKFQVLSLVIADWDVGCPWLLKCQRYRAKDKMSCCWVRDGNVVPMHQYIGRLKDRIREQTQL
jgi:hypothetical protein